MKRYYLDKLNVFQSVIKAIIVNILLTLFLIMLFMLTGLEIDIVVVYLFGILYAIVLIVNVSKSFSKISFYIDDNAIIYCVGKKETKIKLYSITKLEEYFGINYLFGKKTIIIHIRSKRYHFVLSKERADIFKVELENAINDDIELKGFSI